MMYNNYTVGGELYHHGILGQKWGKRNGPPYPLDYADHSTAEKKEMNNKKSGISGKSKIKSVKKVVDKIDNDKKNEDSIKNTKVVHVTSKYGGYNWSTIKINQGKDKNIELHAFSDDVSDDRLKEIAIKYAKNKDEFIKSAIKAIKNDLSDWIPDKSKNKLKDILDIEGVFVTNDGTIEVSLREKDKQHPNVFGGHSLSMEFDIDQPKVVPKHVAMNG